MDNNTIYDEIKDPMMDTAVEVTVSAPAGSGTKVLTVFYNGVLDHNETVSFDE